MKALGVKGENIKEAEEEARHKLQALEQQEEQEIQNLTRT
jgi:hypothetical protein